MVDYLQIAIWGGAAVLGILVLFAVALVYRRRYRASQDLPRSAWSLEDLRAMHRRGDLSESEYAHLRDRVLAQMGLERPHPAEEPPGLSRQSRAGADGA